MLRPHLGLLLSTPPILIFLLISVDPPICNASIFKGFYTTEFAQFENGKKKFGLKVSKDVRIDEAKEWNGQKKKPTEEEEEVKDKNRKEEMGEENDGTKGETEKGGDMMKANLDVQKESANPLPKGTFILVEGIEQSDFGISKTDSDYQRSRPAVGLIPCAHNTIAAGGVEGVSILNIFYESQKTANNYEPEAIRALCFASGMQNFCACNEEGECFKTMANNPPVYVELAPYCDPIEGCHTYLELYQGRLQSEHNPSLIYTHRFDAGPVGYKSPYMKVSAVSCNGCARIGEAIRNEVDSCSSGEFIKCPITAQNLKEEMGCEQN